MSSPFPGMDPYIEACGLWEDFHNHFVASIANTLAGILPERYLVRGGRRSYVVPVEEEHRESFIEIYEDSPERRLVTSVEVLSPSNKRPGTPGWEQYQRKRQSQMLAGVNLVEIDLVRAGQRMTMSDPWPESPYTLLAARAKQAPLCQVWPVHFQRPLPPIPVPLAHADPDVMLSLQPLIDSIYQTFRYAQSIDYTRALIPPLLPEESAWLEQRLRAQGGHR